MDEDFKYTLVQYLRTLTERLTQAVDQLNLAPSWLDYVNALLTFAVLVVAIAGLTTWRKQRRAEIEDNLARRCLVLAHRLRNEINFVRQPYRTRIEGEDQFQAMIRNYQERWDRVAELGAELKVAHIEVRLQWGDDSLLEAANTRFVKLQAMLWKDIQDTILSQKNPAKRLDVLMKEKEKDKPVKPEGREFDTFTVLHLKNKNDRFDDAILATLKDMETVLIPKFLHT